MSGVGVGPASVLRGAGVAAATLAPGPVTRVAALAGSFAAAWRVRPGGLTFLSWSDPENQNALLRDRGPELSSGASWVAVHAGVVSLLRRTGQPWLAGAAYGAVIAVADARLAARFEAMRAARDELAARRRSTRA